MIIILYNLLYLHTQLNDKDMNVLNQITELKAKLNYVTKVLSFGGLQLWEAKEYSKLELDYSNEIKELEIYVELNKEVFA